MNDSLTSVFIRVRKTHFHAMFELLTDKEVYPGQPSVLFTLAEKDGQSQKELAAQLSNKAATVTVMLNRMEKAGLVERRTDLIDQRITRVFLTAKGRQAYIDVKEAMSVMEQLCYANFTAEDKDVFRKLLLRMADNLMKADLPRGN